MSYQNHKRYGIVEGQMMGFQFNYPHEGCIYDIENQRYCFLQKGLTDEQLLNSFVGAFDYARNWLNKQWKPIKEIANP